MKKLFLLLILSVLFLSGCKSKQEVDIAFSGGNINTTVSDETVVNADIGPYDEIVINNNDVPISNNGIEIDITEEETPPPTEKEIKEFLKKIHPGCTVEWLENLNCYEVTSHNVDYAKYRLPEFEFEANNDVGTKKDLENWLSATNLESSVIFKGETTGNSYQTVGYHITNFENISVIYASTTVEMKVLKAYYGDINESDIIEISDSFGVVYQNGEYKLHVTNECSNYIPYDKEYLVQATKLTDGRYMPDIHDLLPLDREYKPWSDDNPGHRYCFFEKYILNNDTALDRQQEEHKLRLQNSERNKQHANLTDAQYGGTEPLTDKQLAIVNDNALSEEQQMLLNRAMNKYGSK